MRSVGATFLLLIITAVLPHDTGAEVVPNLYEATVPVASRSDTDLNAAISRGLAQVLVKVTGSSESLDNPALEGALRDARRYMQQYAYLERRGDDTGLWLRMDYEIQQVNALVTRAGAPLWTANRPSVLVWLVIEDQEGRRFLKRELEPELTASLATGFDERGVPLRLPLFDLSDAAALGTSEAWRLSQPALLDASMRYGASQVLAGRVASLSTGAWLGDWSFFADGQRLDRSVTANTADEFLYAGIAMVVEDMASRFAVAASGDATAGIAMLVDGVNSYRDYASVVSWLEGLELVDSANVEEVRGSQLLLRVYARVDADQLASLLALNERLQPLGRPLDGIELGYQWQN